MTARLCRLGMRSSGGFCASLAGRFTVFSVATERSWKNADANGNRGPNGTAAFGKLSDFAAGLKKGSHVQIEGEHRSREYDKDSVKHKVFECRLESILKLIAGTLRAEAEAGDDPTDDPGRWHVRLPQVGTPFYRVKPVSCWRDQLRRTGSPGTRALRISIARRLLP
jgi:single-strand DNA-binding protein